MTGLEETYRALTAIPFQLGVNNSLKDFAITNIRKKKFRFCKIYNSLYICTSQLELSTVTTLQSEENELLLSVYFTSTYTRKIDNQSSH